MQETKQVESILCFVGGIQRIIHPLSLECPACDFHETFELEGGLGMHKIPGGFVLSIPHYEQLDECVTYLQRQLMVPEVAKAMEYKTAVFCKFYETSPPEEEEFYTPNEEEFPLDDEGKCTINLGNVVLNGWLTHVFTYEFVSEMTE